MSVRIIIGDCLDVLRTLPAESAQTCVTSPPYFGLRDYGHEGQIGMEDSPEAFVSRLVEVFREVWRVLRDDGTLWLNIGDSYARNGGTDRNISSTGKAGKTLKTLEMLPDRKQRTPAGLKEKDLIGIPWRVAFALQADGWYLRQEIIWHKPNPMPESVRDRCTKAHEQVFLLTKQPRYYFDQAAIAEPAVAKSMTEMDGGAQRLATGRNANAGRFFAGQTAPEKGMRRNRRSVWSIPTRPFKEAHFATFPPDLIEPCVLAGCPAGGTVLDPFAGAGTTGLVAGRLQRNATLIELNPEYAALAHARINNDAQMFTNTDLVTHPLSEMANDEDIFA